MSMDWEGKSTKLHPTEIIEEVKNDRRLPLTTVEGFVTKELTNKELKRYLVGVGDLITGNKRHLLSTVRSITSKPRV